MVTTSDDSILFSSSFSLKTSSVNTFPIEQSTYFVCSQNSGEKMLDIIVAIAASLQT